MKPTPQEIDDVARVLGLTRSEAEAWLIDGHAQVAGHAGSGTADDVKPMITMNDYIRSGR